jgi:2',3'-cyclic-nucleotide 2'-phosphodiesterase (5'-nucleotidase family)
MSYIPKEGETCTFQILFTSDVHNAFRDYNYFTGVSTHKTGMSMIAPLMRREKEGFCGTTFIADIGDIVQGNGAYSIIGNEQFKPHPMLAAYDALGYDMVAIGNHEFNYGIPALLAAFEGYRGDKLCGNIFDREGNLLEGFEAYTIKTLPVGLRIAFIGVVSPNVDKWDAAKFKSAEYTSESAAAAVRRTIDKLKNENSADVFIVLGHMHIKNELDRDGSGAEDVVAMNPEIDVFLGAHFHLAIGAKDNQHIIHGKVKFAENKSMLATYGKALITATYENGKWSVKNKIGTYDESDVKTDIIEIISDAEIDKITEAAHAHIIEFMRKPIGTLSGGSLVPASEIKGTHEVILRPAPLVDFLATVIGDYSNADIVSVSVNDYSVNCYEGTITLGDISRMYIYDNNTIYTVKITGEQLLQWMEWSYAFFDTVNIETDLTVAYGNEKKVYLHDKFCGVDYETDLTKKVGERIKILKMSDGSDFDPLKIYTVAATNYRATTNLLINTKDGIFKHGTACGQLAEMDIKSPRGKTNVLEWIAEYIESQNDKTIYNACKQNWQLVNLNWDAALRAKAIDLINSNGIAYEHKIVVKKTDVS